MEQTAAKIVGRWTEDHSLHAHARAEGERVPGKSLHYAQERESCRDESWRAPIQWGYYEMDRHSAKQTSLQKVEDDDR